MLVSTTDEKLKYPKMTKALRSQETWGSFLSSHYDTVLQYYMNMQLQTPTSLKKQAIALDIF